MLSAGAAFNIEDALLAISFCLVVLRLYVRMWLQARFDAADVFILFSFISFTIYAIMNRLCYRYGVQEFIESFTADVMNFRALFGNDERLRSLLKMMYASQAPYWCAIFFVKFAFIRLYYHLIIPSMKRLRLTLNLITVVTVLCFVLIQASNLFWCVPISLNWDLDATCWAFFQLEPYFIGTVGHVLTDLLIYVLPFFLLPALRTSSNRNSMVSLVAMFSLGFICIVITVVRSAIAGTNGWLPTLYVLFASELASAIIVACCPPLKWLWMSFKAYGYKAKRGTFADRYPDGDEVDMDDYRSSVGHGDRIGAYRPGRNGVLEINVGEDRKRRDSNKDSKKDSTVFSGDRESQGVRTIQSQEMDRDSGDPEEIRPG